MEVGCVDVFDGRMYECSRTVSNGRKMIDRDLFSRIRGDATAKEVKSLGCHISNEKLNITRT